MAGDGRPGRFDSDVHNRGSLAVEPSALTVIPLAGIFAGAV